MAVPAEISTLNLAGKFTLNKSLSDDTDKILTLQGVGWLKRKAIAAATLYVSLKHNTDENGVEVIVNSQNLTGGVGSNTETRVLDWQEREVEDQLFGPLITKTKRARVEELNREFLKEGWLPASVENGVVFSVASSDTPKSGTTWVAEIIWDIQEVNGERRYVRRIFFTGPKGEELAARQVFDYTGAA